MDQNGNWDLASPHSNAKSITMSPGQLRNVLRDVRDPRNANPLPTSSSSPDMNVVNTNNNNNNNGTHYPNYQENGAAVSSHTDANGTQDYGFYRAEFSNVSSGVKTWSGATTNDKQRKKIVHWDPTIPDQPENRPKLKEKNVKKEAPPKDEDGKSEETNGNNNNAPTTSMMASKKGLSMFFRKGEKFRDRTTYPLEETELDDLMVRMLDLRDGLKIGKKKWFFTSHEDAFTGSEFSKWVQKVKNVDATAAAQMGQTLISRGMLICLTKKPGFYPKSDFFYRPKLYETPFGALTCLNRFKDWILDEVPDPLDLTVELVKLLIRIFTDHGKDGRINFVNARNSREGTLFLLRIAALQKVDLAQLQNQMEKAAFALNMLHIILGAGFILWGAPMHTSARYSHMTKGMEVMGHNITAEIYAKVLTGERLAGMLPGKHLKAVSLGGKIPDLLCCMYDLSDSGAPIRPYTRDGVEAEVQTQVKAYLAKNCKVQGNELWFPHNFRDRVDDMWGDAAGLASYYNEKLPGTIDPKSVVLKFAEPFFNQSVASKIDYEKLQNVK